MPEPNGTGAMYDAAGTNWNGAIYKYDAFNQMTTMLPKDLLLEAKQVSDRGDLEDAARQLVSLAGQYPDDMDVRLTCAAVLFRLKCYTDAALHFERVLKDRPVYEWASLGLFHSLWKTDKKHEAIEEIRRFRDAGGDSMEYRRFFKDLEKFR